jgi:hypothetical protein
MTATFTPLPKGFVPIIKDGPALLPEWLQKLFDNSWSGDGFNGDVCVGSLKDGGEHVTLHKTSFAVRGARFKENRFPIADTGKTREQLERAINRLHTRHKADDITINAWIDDEQKELVVIVEFKTVNIASFGLSQTPGGKKRLIAGDHRRAGVFPFSVILNEPDIFAHAVREIFEKSGCIARNLRVIGVVLDDPKSYNFVGIFDAPMRTKGARRNFKRRQDPDGEMRHLVVIPEGKVDEVLSSYPKQWPPLAAAAKWTMSL